MRSFAEQAFSHIRTFDKTTTTTTVIWPFFWDHPGEPVPKENFWTLWCKGRLTETDTPTIQLGATPSGLTSAHLHHPSYIFYRPYTVPAAQPTVSKHWRQEHSTKMILKHLLISNIQKRLEVRVLSSVNCEPKLRHITNNINVQCCCIQAGLLQCHAVWCDGCYL